MPSEDPVDQRGSAGVGVGTEDLPAVMRELFDQCVADARQVADPARDADAFVEALWEQVDNAFGLTRREWPPDAPKPWPVLMDEQRGVAEAVLEGRAGGDELPG